MYLTKSLVIKRKVHQQEEIPNEENTITPQIQEDPSTIEEINYLQYTNDTLREISQIEMNQPFKIPTLKHIDMKKLRETTNEINTALRGVKTKILQETCDLIKSAAILTTRRLGLKQQHNKVNRKEPPWRHRRLNKIQQLRKSIS